MSKRRQTLLPLDKRKCTGCQRMFLSEGKGHRRCKRCAETKAVYGKGAEARRRVYAKRRGKSADEDHD